MDHEIEKIRQWWFGEPLQYQFGAVVVINEHEPPFVIVIENDAIR